MINGLLFGWIGTIKTDGTLKAKTTIKQLLVRVLKVLKDTLRYIYTNYRQKDMIAEIKEYLAHPSHSGKRYLIKKIVGTKDNIEKKVLDYIDVRMNDKSMIRVIKFSVSIKSGKYTAYDWTYKPTYRQLDIA